MAQVPRLARSLGLCVFTRHVMTGARALPFLERPRMATWRRRKSHLNPQKERQLPGPSMGCLMNYPTLPIGFHWAPLEGPGVCLTVQILRLKQNGLLRIAERRAHRGTYGVETVEQPRKASNESLWPRGSMVNVCAYNHEPHHSPQ